MNEPPVCLCQTGYLVDQEEASPGCGQRAASGGSGGPAEGPGEGGATPIAG